MNLAGAIAPPALKGGQYEVGLLFEHGGSTFFDGLERLFGDLDHDAARTRAGHDRNCLDYTEISGIVFVRPVSGRRLIRCIVPHEKNDIASPCDIL